MSPRPFSSPPRLERLLERAARHPRHRAEFYRGLLEEPVWVPGVRDEEGVMLQPFDLDGRKTFLLFTSRRRLEEALRSHAGALELPGRALLEALPPFDAIVIDHATRLQKELTPSEVMALLDGSIFGLLRDDVSVTRTILGRPKDYPVRLLDALRPILAEHHGVRAAYLCQEQQESTLATRVIIGLEGEEVAEAVSLIGAIAEGTDVIAIGRDAASEYMRRETEPWYRREEIPL